MSPDNCALLSLVVDAIFCCCQYSLVASDMLLYVAVIHSLYRPVWPNNQIYFLKFSSSHIQQRESGEMIFSDLFYLTQYVKIIISTCNQYTNSVIYFTFIFTPNI